MEHSDIIDKIRLDYLFIKQHIREMVRLVDEATLVSNSVVYQLPTFKRDDIGTENADVTAEPLRQQLALNAYVEHCSDFTLKHEQPGLMAKRLPGWIAIRTDHEQEILERIEVINRLKKEFDNFIKNYAGDNVDQRHHTVAAAVPNLIRKAVVRKLLVAPANTFSLSFSWSHSSSRSKAQNRAYWEKKLDNALVAKGHHIDDKDWAAMIKMEKAALQNANDSEMFRIIRPLRVNPIMNIKYDKDEVGGTFKKTTMNAHSPLLILNQTPECFEMRNYKGKSLSSSGDIPIIERLHLYAC